MHRRTLLQMLDRYEQMYPEETTTRRMREFVVANPDCFERSCAGGHITASAWILSPDSRQFLLTHHRKLGRWLQLGGHCDGETEPHVAAMREAFEESGLHEFGVCATDGELVPLDLDIHEIPPFGDEPAHLHYDVRFQLIAHDVSGLRVSDESHALHWFPMAELERYCSDASMVRMGYKARAILGHMEG